MAYVAEGGTGMGAPIIMGSGGNDGLLGGGGIGALLIGALLFGGGFGGFGRGAAAGIDPAITGIQNQLNGLQNSIGQNAITDSIANLAQNNVALGIATNQAVDNNAREILGGLGSINTNLAAGNFTTLQSINGALSAITAQNNQGSLQQLNSFNQLNTAMLQGFNECSRDNAQAFNQLIMGQNTLSSQMAACCCDLKSTIKDDGNATRALINDINVQNLQAQLADAKTQNIVCSQQIAMQNALNAQAATIINHLKPVCPQVV